MNEPMRKLPLVLLLVGVSAAAEEPLSADFLQWLAAEVESGAEAPAEAVNATPEAIDINSLDWELALWLESRNRMPGDGPEEDNR